MPQPTENPFQTPAAYEISRTSDSTTTPSVPWIFGKWSIICGISAAPSFVFGLTISKNQPLEVAGMVCGIVTFIVAYTVAECTPLIQRLIRRRHVQKAAMIGYGMRMTISIVFPLGAYIDIPTGALSLTVTDILLGGQTREQTESLLMSFTRFYSTTLIQGFLLNVILLLFVAGVFGIAVLFSRPR